MSFKYAAVFACGAAVVATLLARKQREQASKSVSLSLTVLQTLTEKCVKRLGYSDKEVAIITDVLLYAQLRGNNQGLIKLVTNSMPQCTGSKPIQITRESNVSCVVDGQQNLGMLVVTEAMELAAEKASQSGIGIVGTVNTASTTGAIGYYAAALAKMGLVSIVMSQSSELVAPCGTYKPFFGTNPVAFGLPTRHDQDPLIFDMATSAIAYYGVVEAALSGESIPGDVAYDSVGRETTDPTAALKGAIRPFDRSYKSSGLALMVELFTGALVGGALVNKSKAKYQGNLIIAINPELFRGVDDLRERVATVADHMKSLPPVGSSPGVQLPGERSARVFSKHVTQGSITVPRVWYDKLQALASESDSK